MSNRKLNKDRLKGKFNKLLEKFTKRDKRNFRKWNLLKRMAALAERLKGDPAFEEELKQTIKKQRAS